jgi:hypothetical protein
VTQRLGDFRFSREFSCDLDWDAWERLSRERGSFVYTPEALLLHRIHPGSETTRQLENSTRRGEDLAMFRRFWPDRPAGALARLYALSERSNRL